VRLWTEIQIRLVKRLVAARSDAAYHRPEMDLQLYLRVLWRFRLLVAVGFVFAVLLSTLSYTRISFKEGFTSPSIAYRDHEEWVSYATLFVTQPGFPWGYSVIQQPSDDPETQRRQQQLAREFADPSRFSSLAVLYSYLATSDPVRAIIRRDGPLGGKIDAGPVINNQSGFGVALPLIQIAGIAQTPFTARRIAERTTAAFRKFLEGQQQASSVPPERRVLVTVVKKAQKPELMQKRSKTMPIVVFMTIMIAVSGLAFLLENVRTRDGKSDLVTDEGGEAAELTAIAAARRSA
jgi:hypothetical protein